MDPTITNIPQNQNRQWRQRLLRMECSRHPRSSFGSLLTSSMIVVVRIWFRGLRGRAVHSRSLVKQSFDSRCSHSGALQALRSSLRSGRGVDLGSDPGAGAEDRDRDRRPGLGHARRVACERHERALRLHYHPRDNASLGSSSLQGVPSRARRLAGGNGLRRQQSEARYRAGPAAHPLPRPRSRRRLESRQHPGGGPRCLDRGH